jgi:pimeloyl-ACP methyl ester carboxylesterase
VAALLVADHRVLAPDRPGYGATPEEATGLAGNAEAIAGFIRQHRADPATVVAHSWSGGAAVLLAEQHPELVGALVLIGAACTPDSVNVLDRLLTARVVGSMLTFSGLVGISAVLPPVRRVVERRPEGRWSSTWRRKLLAALPDQGVLGGGRGALGRHRRTFMVEQQALNAELPEVAAAAGRLLVPTMVVSGDWDLVVPVQASVTLARTVPGAELVLVPEAGHFVARDDPAAVAGVIRQATGMWA